MNPERKIEIKLWSWLSKRMKPFGNILEIFFNSKNELGCETFKVRGEIRTIPDLVIKFFNPYNGLNNYMAIEVKDSNISKNVKDGLIKLSDEYLINYIEGKTKYIINNKEIKINHFALATQFSPEGHLYFGENPEINESMRGKTNIAGKTIPIWEYAHSKEGYRIMLSYYSKYRKDNKLSKIQLPSLGILISDNLLNYTCDEAKITFINGNPIFQGIQFNTNSMRWSQCLMKL